MSSNRRIIAVLVAAVVLGGGLTISASAAQAKTCQSPAGRYEVTPPAAGSSVGADPAELAAANCTLGFHEQQAYPLSVIFVCLLATVGTLLLVRRGASYDAIGSQA